MPGYGNRGLNRKAKGQPENCNCPNLGEMALSGTRRNRNRKCRGQVRRIYGLTGIIPYPAGQYKPEPGKPWTNSKNHRTNGDKLLVRWPGTRIRCTATGSYGQVRSNIERVRIAPLPVTNQSPGCHTFLQVCKGSKHTVLPSRLRISPYPAKQLANVYPSGPNDATVQSGASNDQGMTKISATA